MNRALGTFKKYFIPHSENDHRPHLLRPRAVAFVGMIVLIAEAAFVMEARYVAPRSSQLGAIFGNVLIDGTNQNRVQDHVAPLRVSLVLEEAAQAKADDMARNGYFAHTSPAGLTPWYWFGQAGYDFLYAGENLAVNFVNSDDVTNAWMNSPEHRANILNANFTEIGMATAQGTYKGRPATFVVELFGTPASAVLTVRPPEKIAVMTEPAETFAAVKGAATARPAPVPPVASDAVPAAQSTVVDHAIANPRDLADYFYYFVAALFVIAVALNVFIKWEIQHPTLTFGGVLVVALAGLLIMVNQHVAFLPSAIL